MKHIRVLPGVLIAGSFALALGGCSSSATQSSPGLPALSADRHSVRPAQARYVYVTDRTQEELLVYPAGVQNPSPILTYTQGINQVGGVAVDASGNAYVANAGAAEVLEFAPGGTGIIQTFSQTLHHPVNVAVDTHRIVYVADQNSRSSEIVEFAPSGGAPIRSVATPDGVTPRGVAVDSSGNLFVSISGIGDFWPPPTGVGECKAISGVYEYLAGSTQPPTHIGSGGIQQWGLALDAAANLYESDYCITNTIWTFSPPAYSGPAVKYPGTYSEPIYMTIGRGNVIAIPNANGGSGGYVTVQDIGGVLLPITITNGLQGPIGAAVGS
jgi:hypothetical protein